MTEKELEQKFKKQAKESGGSLEITNDMREAFKDADVVYPKSWASFAAMEKRTKLLRKGDKTGLDALEKTELKENAKHKDWECTEKMMKPTKQGKALYMHCLPADVSGLSCKEGEVAVSVFDRYRVETFKEAGYKPYVIAAMMVLTKFENPAKTMRYLMKNKLKKVKV